MLQRLVRWLPFGLTDLLQPTPATFYDETLRVPKGRPAAKPRPNPEELPNRKVNKPMKSPNGTPAKAVILRNRNMHHRQAAELLILPHYDGMLAPPPQSPLH